MESFYQSPYFILIIVWSYAWQGLALWRSAKLGQRNWFIVNLIFSTLGIIQIAYLFMFAKKRLTWHEIKQWRNVFVKKVPEE